MKVHPILFKGPMVRAILEGKKTQTRRVIKHQPPQDYEWLGWITSTTGKDNEVGCACWKNDNIPSNHLARCRYQPEDRLWVREPFWVDDGGEYGPLVFYAATDERSDNTLTPSIFMPRHYSRLTLEVFNVRVERLQEISRADCVCEGLEPTMRNDPEQNIRVRFKELWNSINAKCGYGFALNPWVWVIEFKRVDL